MGNDEINPWEWSKGFGFSQAIKVSEPQELLVCSGQTAIGPDGSMPESADMGTRSASPSTTWLPFSPPGA